MTVRASGDLNEQAGADTSITSGATTNLGGTVTNINGGITTVNGSGLTRVQGGVVLIGGVGCQPAARLGDPVVGVAVGNPGAVTATVAGGSSTVCIG